MRCTVLLFILLLRLGLGLSIACVCSLDGSGSLSLTVQEGSDQVPGSTATVHLLTGSCAGPSWEVTDTYVGHSSSKKLSWEVLNVM